MKQLLMKSKELFESWNNNSILYIHWKGNDHILDGLNGDSDLDVLLHKEDRIKGCQILYDVGFVKFSSQFGSRFPNVEDWLGFDEESGRIIHLHLHYALVSGHAGLKEYDIPWIEDAFESRVQDPDTSLYIMNPNLELVTLYTRLILKSKKKWIKDAKVGRYVIDKHFQKEIGYIKQRVDWIKVKEISVKYYNSFGDDFCCIMQEESLSSEHFLQLYHIVSKTMSCCSRYPAGILTVMRAYYDIVIKGRNKLKAKGNNCIITRKVMNSSNGVSIAFIGQDGCGKSTVTKEIVEWLNWKIEASRFYLGSGDHYNGFLKKLITQFSGKRNSISVSSKNVEGVVKQHKRKKNVKSLLSAMLVSMNLLTIAHRAYKQVVKSEKYRRRGGIALFDRFPQTQFYGIYDGPKIVEYYKRTGLDFWIVRVMANIEKSYLEKIQNYQPKLIFKLILPPEESIRRKPFENIDDVTKKHDITKKLMFPNSQVFEIDATQDYCKEIIFIKNRIWESIIN